MADGFIAKRTKLAKIAKISHGSVIHWQKQNAETPEELS